MPEGPEIRRIANWISDAIEGEVAEAVRLGPKKVKQHEEELSGLRIERVEPRAKAIVFHLEGGRAIFSHTQLYGRWYVLEPGESPPSGKKLALSLETKSHTATLCSTSRVEVLDEADLTTHKFLSKLGPDALDEATTAAMAREALEANASRALGTVLLDQSVLAGLGNYLRSEILFLAGLLPERTFGELDEAKQAELVELCLAVPRRAYTSEGFTTSDEHIEAGLARGVARRDLKRYVYRHDGEPCPVCQTTIEKRRQASRDVFVCPNCQR